MQSMNKTEFFRDIDWEAPLSRDFITKLYGYSLCDPALLVDVLAEYEKHGRDRVKYVYRLFVDLEEQQLTQEYQPVAKRLTDQINAEYERKVKEYEWKKKRYLQSLSEEELKQMLTGAQQ